MTEETRRGYKIEIVGSKQALIDRKIISSERELSFAAPSDGSAEALSLTPSENEFLVIDGKVTPYLKTEEGFRIYFQPPAPTLLEAARSYVDTQREK